MLMNTGYQYVITVNMILGKSRNNLGADQYAHQRDVDWNFPSLNLKGGKFGPNSRVTETTAYILVRIEAIFPLDISEYHSES